MGEKLITNPPDSSKLNNEERMLAKFDSIGLDETSLSEKAFQFAMQGFEKMVQEGALQNTDIISIVDFSLPSSQKRFFVLDLVRNKILFNTYVAHGRNSGAAVATSFSNAPESNKSSLGFYITKNTYRGENGFSLRLQGVEEGINDNAFQRNIVLHGAPYVSERVIATKGYLGRSLGCPAVPLKLNRAIISRIKEGTCLFLYGPDERYAMQSKLIVPSALPLMMNDSLPENHS